MEPLMHPGTIVGSTLAIELFSSRFTMRDAPLTLMRIIHERYTHSGSVFLSTPGGASLLRAKYSVPGALVTPLHAPAYSIFDRAELGRW